METIIKKSYKESIDLKEAFFANESPGIIKAAQLIADCLNNGNKLILAGNGGSAADAQHIAAEFVNRFMLERPPLPALAITTDTSVITSIGNDYDFKDIFSKQVKALGREGDILMVMSTSGSSPNILEAIKAAGKMGIHTIGLAGKNGGRMADMVDTVFIIKSSVTARVQEVHITLGHIICELVEHLLFYKVDTA